MKGFVARVPAGIGDFLWIYKKLSTLEVPLRLEFARGDPPRLQPLEEILPWVESARPGEFSYKKVMAQNIPAATPLAYFVDRSRPIWCEANTHLEAGRRLEEWLPDMPIEHHPEMELAIEYAADAERLLPLGRYVLIYSSGYRSISAWKAWGIPEWNSFLGEMWHLLPEVGLVLVGAEWDAPFGRELTTMALRQGMPLFDLCGDLHLAGTVHAIQGAEYFVAFPSGIAILAEMVKTPTTMFYPDKLKRLMGTWADPALLASGDFRERLFRETLPKHLAREVVERISVPVERKLKTEGEVT